MQSDASQVEPVRTRRSIRAIQSPSTTDAAGVAAPALTRRQLRAASAETPVEPVRVPAEPFELLVEDPEPIETEHVEAEQPEAEAEAEQIDAEQAEADAFEAAARLFAFTGENAIVTDEAESAASAPEGSAPEDIAAHVAEHHARRPRGRAVFKRVAAASASIGVIGVVGLMAVGLTTPAEAVMASSADGTTTVSVRAPLADETSAAADDEIQAYVAPATTAGVDLGRHESYSTMTMAELAAESGIKNVSNFFVNDPNAAIQWPFAVGVPISYGFGMRSGAMHEGVDFTPGSGAPIQAIADGTVRVATNSGGGYGVHVIIDHVIDGQLVSSHYAHMIYDSITVTEGEQVTVGQVIGHTGNTGRSFGAHTHFEILLNGTTPIDPIPWLREHAGG